MLAAQMQRTLSDDVESDMWNTTIGKTKSCSFYTINQLENLKSSIFPSLHTRPTYLHIVCFLSGMIFWQGCTDPQRYLLYTFAYLIMVRCRSSFEISISFYNTLANVLNLSASGNEQNACCNMSKSTETPPSAILLLRIQ